MFEVIDQSKNLLDLGWNIMCHIRADEQELQQFHHLVIRPATPIFNPLGQYCPVRRCCTLYKYSTPRELHTHWQYLHQPNRQIYKCGKCRKMFGIKSRCSRHISFKHYVREDNIHKFLNTIVTPNVDYIETRGAMLPRLGTAEENAEIIDRGKREASRKREEEARASLVHLSQNPKPRGRGTTMEGIGGTYELVSGVGLVLVEEASATSSLRVQGEQATLPPPNRQPCLVYVKREGG
ncbi:unnamed protein product [Mytilus edulis]|uniref:C2H2-type domain-containing protein n=1 Tax=Mytilus edulis TaxID=6550 RepID=A0A8S3QWE4_MYTED|nr:unnamed protein product [Mytilus edulis]